MGGRLLSRHSQCLRQQMARLRRDAHGGDADAFDAFIVVQVRLNKAPYSHLQKYGEKVCEHLTRVAKALGLNRYQAWQAHRLSQQYYVRLRAACKGRYPVAHKVPVYSDVYKDVIASIINHGHVTLP